MARRLRIRILREENRMEGSLELLIELEDAGVRELRRAGDAIAVCYFSHLSIITPLSVCLRLAIDARRRLLLSLLRKSTVPVAGYGGIVRYVSLWLVHCLQRVRPRLQT
jgi:hypothetical protein